MDIWSITEKENEVAKADDHKFPGMYITICKHRNLNLNAACIYHSIITGIGYIWVGQKGKKERAKR